MVRLLILSCLLSGGIMVAEGATPKAKRTIHALANDPRALAGRLDFLHHERRDSPEGYSLALEVINTSTNPGCQWLALGMLASIPEKSSFKMPIGTVKKLSQNGTPYVRLQAADWMKRQGNAIDANRIYLEMARDEAWGTKVSEEAPMLLLASGAPLEDEEVRRLKAHYVTRVLGPLLDLGTPEALSTIRAVYDGLGMRGAVETYARSRPDGLATKFLERVRDALGESRDGHK